MTMRECYEAIGGKEVYELTIEEIKKGRSIK